MLSITLMRKRMLTLNTKVPPQSPARQRGKAGPAALAGLFIVLMIVWTLWSGMFKPLLIGLGLFSCLLCVWLAARMRFFRSKELLALLPRLPRFWLWLLGEIVKSSIEVARVVLSPSLPASPTIINLKCEPQTEMGRVILGNAITLTPGTVTLDIFEDNIVVHCLTTQGAADMRNNVMNQRVVALEQP